MADFLTKRARSDLMSRIRGKNTQIEQAIFHGLKKLGIPFQRHKKALPGCPDVVIEEARTIVFVDGDFWHGRNYEQLRPKLTRHWRTKIESNIARDSSCRRKLRRLGWRVMRLWGKDIERNLERAIRRIVSTIGSGVGGNA
jgi:DNA mismatch endonuclease, patch repair protein